MSYRTIDRTSPGRPLIDFIPDHRPNNDDFDVSDEDEAFYAKDEDTLISPKWNAMISRTTNRVPRRIQRYLVIYLIFLCAAWLAWRSYLGPRWEANRELIRQMDAAQKGGYGSNIRPEFTDMIQVKEIDQKHVPGTSGAENKRLIVVGDVHGCKEELEALLKKVDFNEANDHLVLTGDMIAKGAHML